MNIKKFSKSAVPGILEHCERSESDINRNRSNENIDTSRTRLNYNLAEKIQPKPSLAFFKDRLDEVKVHGNAKVFLLGWVVTAPQSLPEEEHKKFFEACFDFFAKTYGEQNAVLAFCHLDESQPHMHYFTIPIVNGKNGEKLCAKEVITRNHLREIHPKMERFVSEALGHHINILNGATRFGNKTVAQLKKQDKYIARAADFYNAYLQLCIEKEFDPEFEKMKKLIEEKIVSEKEHLKSISHTFSNPQNVYEADKSEPLFPDLEI